MDLAVTGNLPSTVSEVTKSSEYNIKIVHD
jgi:hypothetical protein